MLAIACTQAFRRPQPPRQRLDSTTDLREAPVAPVDASLLHYKMATEQCRREVVGADQIPELRGTEDQSPFELWLRSHTPFVLAV